MNNAQFLKTAALELYALDNNEIVKVAGVLKRLKNWFKKQFDSEYSAKVEDIKNQSSNISSELSILSTSLNNLDNAIKDSDIESYQLSLDEVKKYSLELAKKLNGLGIAANKAKIKKNYTNKDEFLIDPERPEFNSEYDVPTELDTINKPLQSFTHFKQFTVNDVNINDVVFNIILKKVVAAVSRPGVSSKELASLSAGGNQGPFAQALKKAILDGTLRSNKLAIPSKKIKYRPANQMDIEVLTSRFDVPNTGLNLQMVVTLVDLLASHVSRKVLSVKFVNFVTALRKNQVDKDLENEMGELEIAEPIELDYPDDYDDSNFVNDSIASINNKLEKIALTDTRVNDSLLKVPGIGRTTPSFKTKLIQVANDLGINPDHLATVISFETGGTFDPSITNKAGSGATGLIQFMPSTARNLGTTTEALARMSGEQQLDYVQKYFSRFKNLKTLNDVYMAVLYPATIGKPGDAVLFSNPSKAYLQNKGFDKENKGYVTVNDVSSSIHGSYNAAKGDRLAVNEPATNVGKQMQNNNVPSEYSNLMSQLLACGPLEAIVRKAIVKELLPNNNFVINIDASNIESKSAFASVLSSALREDLGAKPIIHHKDDQIEVSCSVIGSYGVAKEAILALCSGLIDAFEHATLNNVGIKLSNDVSELPIIKLNNLMQHKRLFSLAIKNAK